MNKHLQTLAASAVIAAGLAAATALYAQDYQSMPHGSTMDQDVMRGTRGMIGGVMADVMNMRGRSGDMGMRDHCNAMMQGGQRPNDQWRRPQPGQRGQRQA